MSVLCRVSLMWVLIASACSIDEPAPGTQIGVEENGPGCETLSEEAVDGAEQPAGFEAPLSESLDEVVGTFTGPPLDDEEEALPGEVVVTLTSLGGDFTLVRTEVTPGDGGSGTEMAFYCPDWAEHDVTLVIEAPGLPRFEAVVPLKLDDEGGTTISLEGEEGFDGPLPEPTSFDPASVDAMWPSVHLSGNGEVWWVYVSWRAERHDGLGEDGSHSLLSDYLLSAELR